MAGFAHSKAIERRYAAQLAKVAKEVGKLAARFADDVPGLVRALKEYAARLEPWAAQIADRFIGEVDRANARAWAEKSQTIAKALKGDVARSAIGLAAQERHFAQVTLITSLPLEAAARAQKLAEDAARGGKRAGDVREAILETESVTASRAQLIARTEIAKANAALTQARAQMAGITHYIWRTMQDEDVRESHAALEGQIFAFDAPPVVDEAGAYAPGGCYNCFTGDTLCRLDADMLHVLRSHYCGTVREIHTAGSRYGAIIVTPNHPMKTATGWKPAADVQAGDTLCAQDGGDAIPFAKLFTDYATCSTWGEGDLYGRRTTVEARTLDPAKLAQHRQGGTKDAQLYVTSVTDRHFDGDVYTVATRKGWQRVGAGAICQNCRCFAEPILTQPDAPLELIAPGTTIEQRAAEVATTIARSVAARKAAATRAAKKAETVASRAIAAREAKAVAQVERGVAELRAAAAKTAEKVTRQAGTVSAIKKGKKAATVAAKAGETAMTRNEQIKAFMEAGNAARAAHEAAVKAAKDKLGGMGIRVTETIGSMTRVPGLSSRTDVLLLEGNTYAHKEAIKAAGGKWSGYRKAWVLTAEQAANI